MICTKHFPGGWEFLWGERKEEDLTSVKTSGAVNKENLGSVVKAACKNSLKELNVDCIDLYYLHRMYPEPIEIEDVMEVYKGM